MIPPIVRRWSWLVAILVPIHFLTGCTVLNLLPTESDDPVISMTQKESRASGRFVASYRIEPVEVKVGGETLELVEGWAERHCEPATRQHPELLLGYVIVLRLAQVPKEVFDIEVHNCPTQFHYFQVTLPKLINLSPRQACIGFGSEEVPDRVVLTLFTRNEQSVSTEIVLTRE